MIKPGWFRENQRSTRWIMEMHNSRRPLDRLNLTRTLTFDLISRWTIPVSSLAILVASVFGFIVRTDTHSHRITESQTRMIAILTRLPSAWVTSSGVAEKPRHAPLLLSPIYNYLSVMSLRVLELYIGWHQNSSASYTWTWNVRPSYQFWIFYNLSFFELQAVPRQTDIQTDGRIYWVHCLCGIYDHPISRIIGLTDSTWS